MAAVVVAAASSDVAVAFVEIGLITLGLSVVARLSDRLGLSPIPAYLLVGLAFGEGGLITSGLSSDFIELAGEIGVLLLLLTLGLEYTGDDLRRGLRQGWPAGILDVAANFTPGIGLGLLLGWDVTAAVLLGGVTYISSSGVIAKLLADLDRMANRETPTILTILVLEDLAMAVYLPLVGVMVVGAPLAGASVDVSLALTATAAALYIAVRYGHHLGQLLAGRSDEALLLGLVGITLLVAGGAQALDVSGAVGAFLVGIALSGPVQQRATPLIGPLRDLFAATFFVLFGLSIDLSAIPPALPAAVLLALVSAATKVATGWWAAARAGIALPGRIRAGTALIARGEFSIVIAGLAVGQAVHPDVVPVATAYVMLLATLGPIATRFADELAPWHRRGAAP